MLAAFCILLLSGITLLSYKKTHSFFHPAVIVSLFFWGGDFYWLINFLIMDSIHYPINFFCYFIMGNRVLLCFFMVL